MFDKRAEVFQAATNKLIERTEQQFFSEKLVPLAQLSSNID